MVCSRPLPVPIIYSGKTQHGHTIRVYEAFGMPFHNAIIRVDAEVDVQTFRRIATATRRTGEAIRPTSRLEIGDALRPPGKQLQELEKRLRLTSFHLKTLHGSVVSQPIGMIRNHWRKDACLLEDKTRSRNPALLGPLAMLRNTFLFMHKEHDVHKTLPGFVEDIAADGNKSFSMMRGRY